MGGGGGETKHEFCGRGASVPFFNERLVIKRRDYKQTETVEHQDNDIHTEPRAYRLSE